MRFEVYIVAAGYTVDAYVDIEECYSRSENPSDDRAGVKLIVTKC